MDAEEPTDAEKLAEAQHWVWYYTRRIPELQNDIFICRKMLMFYESRVDRYTRATPSTD